LHWCDLKAGCWSRRLIRTRAKIPRREARVEL
jgi:hypothetical protein